MAPTDELIDAVYRERVLWARAQSPDEKLLAGPRLFDCACRITMCGIRRQHPEADEEEVQRILRDRLALGRKLENAV